MGFVWVNDENVGISNSEILGNTEIVGYTGIGESLRGLQSLMGGAPQQRKPVSALQRLGQQAAMQNLGRHAPAQHTLPSQYKDSTQFGVKCVGVVPASAWTGTDILPVVSGRTRIYQSFKPEKMIADEKLILTWTNDSAGTVLTAVDVGDAGDLILTAAYVGNYNCFPTAPDQSTGISGRSLANVSLGNGISWPTVNGGIDLIAQFSIEQTAAFRGSPPAGFSSGDLVSLKVLATLNFFGEQLR